MDYLETQTDLGFQNPKSSNSNTRNPNFSRAQDLLLCSTWSNATNDAVVGINQNGGAFWAKAHAYWMIYKEDNFPDRAPDLLMQRFSRIKTVVSKFCGYMAQVEFLSGHTENDKIEKAKIMYEEFEAKKNTNNNSKKKSRNAVFLFEHCWKVLINDQKWLRVTSTKKSLSVEDHFKPSSPVHISLDGDELSSAPKSIERPVGRKLAKEGRTTRKGKFVYDSSPILEKIDQALASNEKSHNDDVAMLVESDKKMDMFLEMEKENLDIKKRKFSMEEQKFGMEKEMYQMDMALKEAEFMKVDISTLTDPDAIEFHQLMKRRIKAKYQSD